MATQSIPIIPAHTLERSEVMERLAWMADGPDVDSDRALSPILDRFSNSTPLVNGSASVGDAPLLLTPIIVSKNQPLVASPMAKLNAAIAARTGDPETYIERLDRQIRSRYEDDLSANKAFSAWDAILRSDKEPNLALTDEEAIAHVWEGVEEEKARRANQFHRKLGRAVVNIAKATFTRHDKTELGNEVYELSEQRAKRNRTVGLVGSVAAAACLVVAVNIPTIANKARAIVDMKQPVAAQLATRAESIPPLPPLATITSTTTSTTEPASVTAKTEPTTQKTAPEAATAIEGVPTPCLPYVPLFEENNLPVVPTAITAYAESGCNPNAISATDDYGILQLNGEEIFNPAENIRRGAQKFFNPRVGSRPNFSAWYGVCTADDTNPQPLYDGIWCQ